MWVWLGIFVGACGGEASIEPRSSDAGMDAAPDALACSPGCEIDDWNQWHPACCTQAQFDHIYTPGACAPYVNGQCPEGSFP